MVVRGAASAERLTEMGGLGAVWARFGIGKIGTHDIKALCGTVQQAHLGMSLVFDQLGLVVQRGPAVVCGQIDDITLDQAVGGNDFGGETAPAGALSSSSMGIGQRIEHQAAGSGTGQGSHHWFRSPQYRIFSPDAASSACQ